MKYISMLFDKIQRILSILAAIFLIGFTLVTLYQVIARYVFGSPPTWTDQTARYLFIWMIMLYMPVIMRKQKNLSFDLISKHLPPKVADFLWLICEILIGCFAAFYCYNSVVLTIKFKAKILVGINIPAPLVYSAQIVGAGFLCLFSFELVYYHIQRLLKDKKSVQDTIGR